MKAYAPHYLNKYPGGRVEYSEDKLEAFDAQNQRRVSLRLDGNGRIVDVGSETGASDKHDLAPIPKNARLFKLYADGRIAKSEEFSERLESSLELKKAGKILSIDEYKADGGFDIDDKGNVSVKAHDASL